MPDEEYSSPFHDDVELIPHESTLLRVIPPTFIDWSGSTPRFTDGAFQDQSEKNARVKFDLPGACMSAIVKDVLTGQGLDPSNVLERFGPTYGLARFPAEILRKRCSQGVQWDPRDWPPGHAVVFAKTRRKKSEAMKTCINEISEWELEPQQT